MGQIYPSSGTKGQESIAERLGNHEIPRGLGTIFVAQNRKRDTNKTINSPVNANVGGNEVKPSFRVSEENYMFDPENIRRLRQMGFTPENILTYLELQKKQVIGEIPQEIVKLVENNQNSAEQKPQIEKVVTTPDVSIETGLPIKKGKRRTAAEIITRGAGSVFIPTSIKEVTPEIVPKELMKAQVLRSLLLNKKTARNNSQTVLQETVTPPTLGLETKNGNTENKNELPIDSQMDSEVKKAVASFLEEREGLAVADGTSPESDFIEGRNISQSPAIGRINLTQSAERKIPEPTTERVSYREQVPENADTSVEPATYVPPTQAEKRDLQHDAYAEQVDTTDIVTRKENTTEEEGELLERKTSPEKTRLKRITTDKLFNTLGNLYGQKWEGYATPAFLISSQPQLTMHKELGLDSNIHTEQMASWRDSDEIKKIQHFVGDFTTP